MTDLSISIINWNTCELLDQCLKSIYGSTKNIDFEIIVVDNASTDSSVEMVQEKYPHVKLIKNSENVGFARANNQAYKISGGKYFMLLNSDTIVLDNSFACLIDWLDNNGNCGACGPMLLNGDKSLQPSWAKLPTFWSEIRGIQDRRIQNNEDLSLLDINLLSQKEPIDVGWVGGACLVVRRNVIEEVGLLDEGYFMYCEETDLCCRINRHGYSVAFVPRAQIIHIGGASSKIIPFRTTIYAEYSRIRFIWRSGLFNKVMIFPFIAWTVLRIAVRYTVKPVIIRKAVQ